MRHKIWLYKHWPKGGYTNDNPQIYCLDTEWIENEAEVFLKLRTKSGNGGLIQIYGYDSPDECILEEHLNDLCKNGLKPTIDEIVTSLSYKGNTYYFPKEGIVRNPFDKTYSFLFKK